LYKNALAFAVGLPDNLTCAVTLLVPVDIDALSVVQTVFAIAPEYTIIAILYFPFLPLAT
jgi:hypothetical protein